MRNPWLGLAAYEEPKGTATDYQFCGRDDETMDVTHIVDNNLFVTLYGSSGVGKTSLLRAGVIPILRRKGYYPLYVRLSQEPKEISFAEAIVNKLKNSGLSEERSITTAHFDANDRLYLWEYFATTRFKYKRREVYPVIILDQFEEVFRDDDKAKAELLLRQIYLLLDDELEMPVKKGWNADTNYRFVASIREDFLFVLEDSIDENSLSLYKNNRYRLRPMTSEQARSVVLVPGKDCIEEAEKEIVAQRVIDLAKNNKTGSIDTLLLSLVCASTYEKKPSEKLILSGFEFWGDNPMNVYYQEAIKQLSGEVVRYIQQNFIQKDGSRKQVESRTLQKDLGIVTYNQLLVGPHRVLTLASNGQTELLHDQLASVIFEDRDAYEERERNWKFMELQSRFVAEKVNNLVDKGNSYLARRLLMEVLPQDINCPIDKPYTKELGAVFGRAIAHENAILIGHHNGNESAAFSPDGKCIVSASRDKSVRVWNAETGAEIRTFKGHSDFVHSAAFSPDGKRIVSASSDKTIKVWDMETGTEIRTLEGHNAYVNSAAFSPDGKRIVSASSDRTVKVWHVETETEIRTLEGHTDYVHSAAFSPDDKRIVSASRDKTIKLWDIDTGSEILTLEGHNGYVYSAVFSPDGKRIVSASGDKTIRVWDVETGTEILTIVGHRGYVNFAAFSPDGKRIASASSDRTVRIWDAETGAEILTLEGHNGYVNSAAFSPDGKRIVSASRDKTVRVWNAETGVEIRTLEGHTDYVHSAAFSPDGKRIVSASGDKTIRVWDVETGSEILTLEGHNDCVYFAAFSPDGKRVVSASNDKTVRVWDIETGTETLSLKGHTQSVYSAVFSTDGKHIVSVSKDRTVRIGLFHSLQDIVVKTRERFKDRPLTPKERRLYYLE